MSHVSIAFFNNKGGVGKTSLVLHVAWMFSELGKRVVAADLDPQANLTAAMLGEDQLEDLWIEEKEATTIFRAVEPLSTGEGDVRAPELVEVSYRLGLVPGDLALSSFEDELASEWSGCLDGKVRSFRVISAFWRVLESAAERHRADVVLIDLGPNLGAMNRAALLAADFVVFPVSPDLFSLQGLKNLGPTLRRWRDEWQERRKKFPAVKGLALPEGTMAPAGYVVLQHAVRLDRPARAYGQWIQRIPNAYETDVLGKGGSTNTSVEKDENCLALLKHYRSLMPMALEARKPIFNLLPADGAIGAHFYAVGEARKDFEKLTRELAHRAGIAIAQRWAS